jgi:hypothetical protein
MEIKAGSYPGPVNKSVFISSEMAAASCERLVRMCWGLYGRRKCYELRQTACMGRYLGIYLTSSTGIVFTIIASGKRISSAALNTSLKFHILFIFYIYVPSTIVMIEYFTNTFRLFNTPIFSFCEDDTAILRMFSGIKIHLRIKIWSSVLNRHLTTEGSLLHFKVNHLLLCISYAFFYQIIDYKAMTHTYM